MQKRCLQLLVGLLVTVPSAVFGSEFSELVARVPENANAVILMDVDGILGSAIAKSNGWGQRFTQGAAAHPMYLPPEADKVVVASQFDLVRGASNTWQVALMGLKEPLPMSLIARAEGGYADTVNGVKVAWVPSDAYFIEVNSDILGLLAPANRQVVSRWASREAKNGNGRLSPYLEQASALVGSDRQAILAVDAADTLQPHRLRANLEASTLAKKLNIEETSTLFSTLNGIVVEVTFTDKVSGVVRIDFGSSVTLKDSLAKELILETLGKMGMSLPGAEDWKCSVTGNSIVLAGNLDEDAVRRIFSILEMPTTKFSSLKDANIEESSTDDVAANSLAYFHSIDSLLKDLRGRTKSSTSGDSYWVDRYASKIDRLPILHVDDDLLEYGEKLSETLHIMSGARKVTNLQGASATRAAWSDNSAYNVNGYGYGAYNYSSPQTQERNAINAQANAEASGTTVKIQGWKLIDEATLEIRKLMTKRYDTEF